MLVMALLAASTLTLNFDYKTSEFANAVYHIACLTGTFNCSSEVYSRFWNEQQKPTRQDGEQFDLWKSTFRKLERAQPDPPSAPLQPNYSAHYPSLRLRNRILEAAFSASSASAFRRSIRSFVPPSDALALSRAVDYTRRRLHPWWRARGAAQVTAHAAALRLKLDANGMVPLARQIAAVLEANPTGGNFRIHLLPSPQPEGDAATATFVGNQFFVEILNADKPEFTAWKAMHEMTHSFYETVDAAVQLRIMRQFNGEPALYALLNEALATAVQLITYERLHIVDDDPYRHPWIPRAARAAVPILKQALAVGKPLREGFIPAYIAATRAELGKDAESPRFQLCTAAVITAPGLEAARDVFIQEFRPVTWVSSEAEARLFPGAPIVRLKEGPSSITTSTVPRLEVVVTGPNAAAVSGQLRKLAALPRLP